MKRMLVVLGVVLAVVACRPEKSPPDPAGAPASEGSPPAPAEAWGEAAGGLALRLELDQVDYAADQRISATIRARNSGAGDLRLFDFMHDWVYHVRFESLDGGPAFAGGSGTFIEYDAPEHVILAPGKEWSRKIGLSEEHRRYLRIIPDRKPGDDWDYRPALPAGRWRATITYGHGGDGSDGFWTGSVRSNPVDIVVR
jgi:hypothetical protein